MKLSRREIAAVVAGSALAAKSSAQTPPNASGADTAQAVRAANRRNSEILAKFDIPISTEPAFQFKA